MTTEPGRTRGHDVWTLLGVGVVALAAAVLSFSSLQALAVRAGYSPALAALLPLSIDAQAVVATRAWLARSTGERARTYARALALSAVALSVSGNAGEHAMAAAHAATPWQVVVAIASVPPVALAACAHLAALLAATRPAPEQTGQEAAEPDTTSQPDTRTPLAEHPTEPTARSPERASEHRVSAQPSAQSTAQSARTTTRRTRSPKSGQERARELFSEHAETGTLDQLTGAAVAAAGGVSPATGRRWLAHWRAEAAQQPPHLAVVGQTQPEGDA